MNRPEDKDPARAKLAYFDEWVRRHQQQQKLLPEVLKMRKTAEWEVKATDALREGMPEQAKEVEAEGVRVLRHIQATMPLPLDYDIHLSVESATAAVAVSSMIFETLVATRSEDPSERPEIEAQITSYSKLLEEQGRAADASRWVAQLFPNLSERFATAQHEAMVARGDPLAEERAALAMRTFLHQLKGELFAKAQTHERENMTWPRMAQRLSTRTGAHVLLEQEATHSSLSNWFSNVGKARWKAYSFDDVLTRFIDHVYVVCGAVVAGIKA